MMADMSETVKPRRSRLRGLSAGKKILLAFVAVLAVIAVASAGLIVWLLSGAGVNRFSGNDHPAPDTNVHLVMFRDTRAGANTEVFGSGGGMAGDSGRTDAMMLVRVDDAHGVDLISLPRDVQVDIPACERADGTESEPEHTKLNAAYAYGAVGDDLDTASEHGARCAQRAVEGMTDVPVEGVAVLDAAVVPKIVDALGGVEICVSPTQAAEIPGLKQGCSTLDGEQAFDYAQRRVGVEDSSDVARVERQRAVLEGVAKKLSTMGPGDVGTLASLARDIAPYVTADEGMTDIGFIREAVGALRAGGFHGRTMPVDSADDGVNLVEAPEAGFLWRALRDGTPLPTI